MNMMMLIYYEMGIAFPFFYMKSIFSRWHYYWYAE